MGVDVSVFVSKSQNHPTKNVPPPQNSPEDCHNSHQYHLKQQFCVIKSWRQIKHTPPHTQLAR